MILEKLIKCIRKAIVDGVEISVKKPIRLFLDKNKFSPSKKPTLKIKIGDLILKRTDKLTYQCPNCNELSTIFVGKFIIKKSLYCNKCREKVESKRKRQSEYITKSFKDFKKVVPINKPISKTLEEVIEESELSFSKENDDFKSDHFKRTPTIDEFNKTKEYVKSIEGVPIEGKLVKYYPTIRTNNQMKYSPKVLIDDKLILLYNCDFYCSICGDDFHGRNFKSKSKTGVLCKECSFSNDVFKFRSVLNINKEKVVYQSNPELRLINHYNDNGILIKNGPRVDYYFNGDKKIYKVDFEVPSNRFLIEVKDNHVWHREQMKSGKWQAKEKAAREWCRINGYLYYLIFNVDVLIKSTNQF